MGGNYAEHSVRWVARELRSALLAVCLTSNWCPCLAKAAIMPVPEVQHKTLNATFKGCESNYEGVSVHKFLGIKYASVPARFERAVPVDDFAGAVVDATRYG